MKTEEIIARLRKPAEKRHTAAAAASAQKAGSLSPQAAPRNEQKQNILLAVLVASVIAVAGISLLFMLGEKNRAENVDSELDPSQIEGLTVQADFNPNSSVAYVQISEGQNRNATVSNLGTTLPIISRYNFKALTKDDYEIIGTAPWALNTNFSSNLGDPELIQYLLGNKILIQYFLIRPDVAPLLQDPQALAAVIKNKKAMRNFFEDETAQKMLADPALVGAVANSRLMSFLLISETAKYYREHPKEALKLINSSPHLRALQTNTHVAKAVRENRYLAPIAETLLLHTPSEAEEALTPKAQ